MRNYLNYINIYRHTDPILDEPATPFAEIFRNKGEFEINENQLVYEFDINGLKPMNDDMSHLIGDAALKHAFNEFLTKSGVKSDTYKPGEDYLIARRGPNIYVIPKSDSLIADMDRFISVKVDENSSNLTSNGDQAETLTYQMESVFKIDQHEEAAGTISVSLGKGTFAELGSGELQKRVAKSKFRKMFGTLTNNGNKSLPYKVQCFTQAYLNLLSNSNRNLSFLTHSFGKKVLVSEGYQAALTFFNSMKGKRRDFYRGMIYEVYSELSAEDDSFISKPLVVSFMESLRSIPSYQF